MKVILAQDVKNIGRKGDIKEVATGYAKHFLFPQKLARIATQENVTTIQKAKEKKNKNLEKRVEKIKKQKNKLKNIILDFSKKTSDEGTLFAQISDKEIVSALKKKGFEIDTSHVDFKKQIKEVGDHKVTLSFGNDIEDVDITIRVKKQ